MASEAPTGDHDVATTPASASASASASTAAAAATSTRKDASNESVTLAYDDGTSSSTPAQQQGQTPPTRWAPLKACSSHSSFHFYRDSTTGS